MARLQKADSQLVVAALKNFFELNTPDYSLSFEHLEFAGVSLRNLEVTAVEGIVETWLNSSEHHYKWAVAGQFLWAFWLGQSRVSDTLVAKFSQYSEECDTPTYNLEGTYLALASAFDRCDQSNQTRIYNPFSRLKSSRQAISPHTLQCLKYVLGDKSANFTETYCPD